MRRVQFELRHPSSVREASNHPHGPNGRGISAAPEAGERGSDFSTLRPAEGLTGNGSAVTVQTKANKEATSR